jgi:prepilin-type N-terminal cleavage/methylation domain-containing protein/prepilin-type processing-associated H-X9-DG protein
MRRRAFTLVELLVVVAIISLLIAIVLPSLARAREQARRVQCASNLRQVAIATIAYAGQNRGVMPQPADWPHRPHDWIYWGLKQVNADLNESMITPPLGRPLNPAVLRCPSDDWEDRRDLASPVDGKPPHAYVYSYSMSRFVGSYRGKFRLMQVRNSSDKILFVEEDVRTMEDGMWLDSTVPRPISLPPGRFVQDDASDWDVFGADEQHFFWEPISARHERVPPALDQIPPPDFTVMTAPIQVFMSRRGNVAFVDGHVDFVSRALTKNPRRILPGE